MKVKESALKKVGVTLVIPETILVECNECGQRWQPEIKQGGKLRNRWWVCQWGCNDPRRK